MVKLSAEAQEAVEKGKVEIKVWRAGALQRIEFSAKRFPTGNMQYLVLFTDRFVDLGELVRLAEEAGLPIFAANGKVFPRGKTSADFVGL
ncbi:MAG: hypothetical protein Q7T16_03820 [Candidatus Burarchaeum sp.]|nr:hypothetical protein [Candidatus Burarchaeum sp.]MDO8339760.1 hypothetical protein [Candidatus Burarchaeum sp.]